MAKSQKMFIKPRFKKRKLLFKKRKLFVFHLKTIIHKQNPYLTALKKREIINICKSYKAKINPLSNFFGVDNYYLHFFKLSMVAFKLKNKIEYNKKFVLLKIRALKRRYAAKNKLFAKLGKGINKTSKKESIILKILPQIDQYSELNTPTIYKSFQ